MRNYALKEIVQTPDNYDNLCFFTAKGLKNDYYGNPRYLITVWNIERGTIWAPKITGYRLNKDDGYNIISHNIEEDLAIFINKFKDQIKQ